MKKMLGISVLLNVTLLGSLIFVLTSQRQSKSTHGPVLSEASLPTQTIAPATSGLPRLEPASFHWSQLTSAKDYRLYITHLRAIGCPEVTIEDIVRGDTGRVFARERSELALGESGTGPWSPQAEKQLVAGLLGRPDSFGVSQDAEKSKDVNNGEMTAGVSEPSSSAQSGTSQYPLFLQNVNWNALGFTADQQVAIAQVRQQFQSEINGLSQPPGDAANPKASAAGPTGTSANPGPNDKAGLTSGQTALQNAVDQLQALLGAQGYAAYEQQQYYAWYQPQVLAKAGDGDLTINPKAFSSR